MENCHQMHTRRIDNVNSMSVLVELDTLFKSVTSFGDLVMKQKKERQQLSNKLNKKWKEIRNKIPIGAIGANLQRKLPEHLNNWK